MSPAASCDKPLRLLTLIAGCLLHTPSMASEIPSRYQQVALESHIPAGILYGIALTESGLTLKTGTVKKVRPWPWTLNVAGIPRRYPTRKAAYQGLRYFLNQGIRSIDIGIMQVNWRYHRKKLIDPWHALDPMFNLRVGAQILKNEYNKTNNWPLAIGHYHSPGKKKHQKLRATRYAHRVLKKIKRLQNTPQKKILLSSSSP